MVNRIEDGGATVANSRDESDWIQFSNQVATRIHEDLAPKNVLDAGCASGVLVGQLRARDIDARGIDVSQTALVQVPDTLRPFCRMGSIADPIDGHYDLITCLGVLEQLPGEGAESAIANLCRHSEAVLVSSKPGTVADTVAQLGAVTRWSGLFAAHGFFRDFAFDGSFLNDRATLFRRREVDVPDLTAHYEELVGRTHGELDRLSERHSQIEAEMASIERAWADEVGASSNALNHYALRLGRLNAELNDVQGRLAMAASQLEAVYATRVFRYSNKIRRLYARFRGQSEVSTTTLLEAEGTEAELTYSAWVASYDTLDDMDREQLRSRLAALPELPKVSILIPVYNPAEEYLRAALDSVRAQLYSNWELCIADDCSTQPYVAEVLKEYQALDDRIKIIWRESNGHISASSNSALSLAQGHWICLMDHDDVLAEHALALAVLELAKVPEAGILYSDEDHIDTESVRSVPYFKPDFDPLLLLGQNYFSHLTMVRSDLMRTVHGFREGLEGSQDWDLVLRVIDHLRPDQVVHVPHVLYHWRAHSDSTAGSISAKPYVVEASRRAVQDHLDRAGIPATPHTVHGSSFNRIRREFPGGLPRVSVIILPRSGTHLVRCLESIRSRSTYENLEVIVLDDGGLAPSIRPFVQGYVDWIKVVQGGADLSDSAQRNFLTKHASGDVLLFLHDDVELLADSSIEEMVGVLQHAGIGAVGAKLLYGDMTIQHAGIVLGIGGTVGHTHRRWFDRLSHGYFGRLMLEQCPTAVSWACMGVRRDAFEMVGGFSEEDFEGLFGDVDLCLRLRLAGWRTGWTPYAEWIHFESPDDARGFDGENAARFARDIRQLRQRWGPLLQDDPGYNPNLSLSHETFPLAWPPRKPFT